MFGAFLEPPVAPLLIDAIAQLREDEEDVREGLEAQADDEGTISWEGVQSQRAKSKSGVKQ
ncbi:MAG: hypothetical protein HYX79_09895 [Chloroflexi bacterium]|nr:hypothetical protein [Chloroflexota bacterium]